VQNLVEPNKWFADAVDARQVSRVFLTEMVLILCSNRNKNLMLMSLASIICFSFY
jgi:hypothetical protein